MCEGDAFPGVLAIGTSHVSFSPLAQEEGQVPRAWRLSLEEISEIRLDPETGRLVLICEERETEVMGADMAPFVEALQGRLSALKDGEEEAVLLEGTVDLYVNELMATRGQVTLTNRSLRFRPSRGLGNLIWGSLEIDVPVESVGAVGIVGVRQRLEIVVGDHAYHFRGNLVPRLCGLLDAIKGEPEGQGKDEVLALWPCNLFQGPLSQSGEMVVTRARLAFAPTGRLESLVGIQKKADIPLAKVTRIDVRGLLDRRLVVTMGTEQFVFALSDPMERLEDLQELLLAVEERGDPVTALEGATRRTLEINRLLDRWKSQVDGLGKAPLLLLGQVLHQPRQPGLRRGWLMLTPNRVIFLPVGGISGGERPLAVPLAHLARPRRRQERPGQLQFSVGAGLLSFVPRGGAAFVDHFWSLWQDELELTDEQVIATPDDLAAHGAFVNRRETYRARIPGGVSVNLFVDEGPEEEKIAGRIMNLSFGGGLVMLDSELEKGVVIGLELEHEDEIAVIDARVVFVLRRRGDQQTRHGLAFEDMNYEDAQLVRERVMQLQREDLQRRAEMKE